MKPGFAEKENENGQDFKSGGKRMKELYMIMSDLLELEYNQKSLWYILDALAGGYDYQQHKVLPDRIAGGVASGN